MAETTESIRKDNAERTQKGKQKVDWSGRVFVLPTCTTLPAITDELIDGQVIIKINAGAANQLYIFDKGIPNWVTVGP